MTKWPARIPFDLKMKFEELAERRYTETDQDRWAAIKEWLEKHSVQAPERLPTEPELKNEWNWLDDVEDPASVPPFCRTPTALELQERKRIAVTVRKIVRLGKGLEVLPDAVNSSFSHLAGEDREEILRTVKNALLNLTPVQDVIFDLTTEEIDAWKTSCETKTPST